MHLWRIVQKGGRLGRARINSSDDVWSQTLETRLSIQGQILIWLTFNYWTTWRSTTRWTRTYEGLRGARMFHLVSLSLQISLTDLPGSCLGLCVCVACFAVFVGLVVGFFLWGNLISITGSFQLLTDHVSHLSGNAGKKELSSLPLLSRLLFSSLAAPPASKVIRIQSDHPIAFSSAGCCHGTVESDLLYPSLRTWVSLVRSPSTLSVLVVLALDVALYNTFPPADWRDGVDFLEMDLHGSVHVLPFLLRLSWGGSCMHWRCFRCAHSTEATDCVSGFSPHPFLQRSGWASLFAGEEHLVSHGLTKPWVGQVALRSPTNSLGE